MHLIGSLLDVGYAIWGAAFCHMYLRSSDGHFAHYHMIRAAYGSVEA